MGFDRKPSSFSWNANKRAAALLAGFGLYFASRLLGLSGPHSFRSIHSHVRHFKQQAQNFFARASSCSVRPLLGMAGGTIIKRRLIML